MGGWPAFYLLPLDDAYGPWPSSGEIDILETYNLQANLSTPVLSSLHYGYPIYTDKGLGQVRTSNNTSNNHITMLRYLLLMLPFSVACAAITGTSAISGNAVAAVTAAAGTQRHMLH
jgi:hypothetical protein